jgi:hypothetical protein
MEPVYPSRSMRIGICEASPPATTWDGTCGLPMNWSVAPGNWGIHGPAPAHWCGGRGDLCMQWLPVWSTPVRVRLDVRTSWGRERRPMQPNGTERSKTRVFRDASVRRIRVGCCRENTAANVTFSPYLSVRNGSPGSMWPQWPTGTERGKKASRPQGKAGIFRLRKCADRPKDVRGEADHGRSDHHVGRQRHIRRQRRGRLVHAAQGSSAFRR